MLPEDTLAKGIASRVKPEGLAVMQGFVSLRVTRCHTHPPFHVAEVTQICFPRKMYLYYRRAWKIVWVKASSAWPAPAVLWGGEMGEGARQRKETSKLLLENCFKTPSDFCHMENKRPLLPWSLHPHIICITHCMNSAASHPSSQHRSSAVSHSRGSVTDPHLAPASWPPSIQLRTTLPTEGEGRLV